MEILPLRERRKDPNTIPFLQTHQRDKSFDVVSISKIVSARVAGERVEVDRKVVGGRVDPIFRSAVASV